MPQSVKMLGLLKWGYRVQILYSKIITTKNVKFCLGVNHSFESIEQAIYHEVNRIHTELGLNLNYQDLLPPKLNLK